MTTISDWTSKDVGNWLCDNGFGHYVNMFVDVHQIDGTALLTLTEDDLKQPPMQMRVMGDIKRLAVCLRKLQTENRELIYNLPIEECHHISHVHSLRSKCSLPNYTTQSSVISEDGDQPEGKRSKHLEPEYFKCLLSFFYMFAVFLLTAFVMVIVHDRVPDMKKYPPLPDIVLDNMPYIPWAFEMCEMCGLILLLIWGAILVFHKHRFILMRRMFSISGSIFLLRCVTMVITSLSVPGVHLECQPLLQNDAISEKFARAIEIWKGMGMSMQGVRSCGDYMFSGHTVIVTTLNFFITEYTPLRFYWLHTTTWVINMFAIFFILAAHEHYSIDVFIAFYITTRLILYYHSLANNRALLQQDRRRTRIWFPLFSYFESKCDGIVPNEFEWPMLSIIRDRFVNRPISKQKHR